MENFLLFNQFKYQIFKFTNLKHLINNHLYSLN